MADAGEEGWQQQITSVTYGGFTVDANADAESQLLAVIAQVFSMDLDDLDDAARARVARYVADRWGAG